MKTIILCPGPSLAELSAVPKADLVIGVNRVATHFIVDVWACIDHTLYSKIDHEVLGNPELITLREDRKRHSKRPGTDIEELEEWLPHHPHLGGIRWAMFSMTAAMVYAAWKGATSIDIYGCDWFVDAPDFDGKTLETNRRTAERFELERSIYTATVDKLKLEVTRHGLDG